ncbi:MAG: hypothetical protein ACKVVP_15730 [Chloroflexota bacterium]
MRGEMLSAEDSGLRQWQAWPTAILLFATVLAIATFYVSSERVFYYWDSSNYQSMTRAELELLRGGALASPHSLLLHLFGLWRSLSLDYNYFFTLPLLPFVLVSDTRLSFILGIVLVYHAPSLLANGLIAGTVSVQRRFQGVALCILIGALTPAHWLATLRGYPDSGGAALICLAVFLYLQPMGARDGRRALAIGGLLGLAVLFRRHFLFAAIAFLLAAGMLALGGWVVQRVRYGCLPGNALRRRVQFAATLLGAFGLTIGLIGAPFARRIVISDYGQINSSFQLPPLVNLGFYASALGLGSVALALIGYGIWLVRERTGQRSIIFCGLFFLSWLVIWLAFVREIGDQYLLQITFIVIAGQALLVSHCWQYRMRLWGILGLVAMILFVTLNFWNYLTGALAQVPGPLPGMFAAPRPPVVRGDYDQVIELVRVLRAEGPNNPTYVAASSRVLNADLVHNAEREVFGTDLSLVLLPVAELDSRDAYPLDALAKARSVVVTAPPQLHYPPDQQRVLTLVTDAFAKSSALARDFDIAPKRLQLANGVDVLIYQRARPMDGTTALQTITEMERDVGRDPWRSGERALIRDVTQALSGQTDNRINQINYRAVGRSPELPGSFVYFAPLSGPAQIVGNLDSAVACPTPMRLRELGSDGAILAEQPVTVSDNGFSLVIRSAHTRAVLLISDDSGSDSVCQLSVNEIRIVAMPSAVVP